MVVSEMKKSVGVLLLAFLLLVAYLILFVYTPENLETVSVSAVSVAWVPCLMLLNRLY